MFRLKHFFTVSILKILEKEAVISSQQSQDTSKNRRKHIFLWLRNIDEVSSKAVNESFFNCHFGWHMAFGS